MVLICLPQPLLFSCRPLYSTTMLNLSLCFTGFRDKEEMVSGRRSCSGLFGTRRFLHGLLN